MYATKVKDAKKKLNEMLTFLENIDENNSFTMYVDDNEGSNFISDINLIDLRIGLNGKVCMFI